MRRRTSSGLWLQAGVELASKLYDRPGSVSVALQLICKATEQNGRVDAMAFLAVVHQYEADRAKCDNVDNHKQY